MIVFGKVVRVCLFKDRKCKFLFTKNENNLPGNGEHVEIVEEGVEETSCWKKSFEVN